jgi:hypothetical protein
MPGSESSSCPPARAAAAGLARNSYARDSVTVTGVTVTEHEPQSLSASALGNLNHDSGSSKTWRGQTEKGSSSWRLPPFQCPFAPMESDLIAKVQVGIRERWFGCVDSAAIAPTGRRHHESPGHWPGHRDSPGTQLGARFELEPNLICLSESTQP